MAKFGIGQAVRRVEDQRFLLGQGRYVDDISLSGQCHGVTVLSPHAHARITRIDVAKAKAAPGVLCVLTGADAVAEKLGSFTAHLMPEDFGAPKGHRTFQPVLNAEKVRFVGDRVAFVVAETLAQARDAAELVEVKLFFGRSVESGFRARKAVDGIEHRSLDEFGRIRVFDDRAKRGHSALDAIDGLDQHPGASEVTPSFVTHLDRGLVAEPERFDRRVEQRTVGS